MLKSRLYKYASISSDRAFFIYINFFFLFLLIKFIFLKNYKSKLFYLDRQVSKTNYLLVSDLHQDHLFQNLNLPG